MRTFRTAKSRLKFTKIREKCIIDLGCEKCIIDLGCEKCIIDLGCEKCIINLGCGIGGSAFYMAKR